MGRPTQTSLVWATSLARSRTSVVCAICASVLSNRGELPHEVQTAYTRDVSRLRPERRAPDARSNNKQHSNQLDPVRSTLRNPAAGEARHPAIRNSAHWNAPDRHASLRPATNRNTADQTFLSVADQNGWDLLVIQLGVPVRSSTAWSQVK
jgi:hypothetical protein